MCKGVCEWFCLCVLCCVERDGCSTVCFCSRSVQQSLHHHLCIQLVTQCSFQHSFSRCACIARARGLTSFEVLK